jgi:hypothetical protein
VEIIGILMFINGTTTGTTMVDEDDIIEVEVDIDCRLVVEDSIVVLYS